MGERGRTFPVMLFLERARKTLDTPRRLDGFEEFIDFFHLTPEVPRERGELFIEPQRRQLLCDTKTDSVHVVRWEPPDETKHRKQKKY